MRDKIMRWLRECPGLENRTAEWIGDLPGCAGLCYQGEQEISRTADILGNEFVRRKLRWKLVTNTDAPVELPLGTAPVLGLLQTVRLEKGQLTHLDEMQIPRWETELTVEFTTVPENMVL